MIRRIGVARMVEAVAILLCCFCATASASVWYVDKDNSGAQDGTSWSTGFSTVQQGIDAAFDLGTVDAEVWVAEGVYNEARTSIVHPAPDDVNTGSVLLKEGVAVYGGFIGIGPGENETERTQRNWATHVTIFDGSTFRSVNWNVTCIRPEAWYN